jgi:hypothetical protein
VATQDKDISSAEMTCTWRCDEPNISGDKLSHLLATPEGTQKAREYQQEQYELAPRHFSVRAGYFLKTASELLATREFDSIVSLGSGLSLLTHCIASQSMSMSNEIVIVDSDLDYMIQAREEKLLNHQPQLPKISDNFQFNNISLDIETAYQSSKAGHQGLGMHLPGECKRPLFLLEGICYFLSNDCLSRLFNAMKHYDHSAIIFDYWPDEAPKRSAFFTNVLQYFKTSLPEDVQSIVTPSMLAEYSSDMQILADCWLDEAEQDLLQGKYAKKLIDPNTYIPAKICTLVKKPLHSKL